VARRRRSRPLPGDPKVPDGLTAWAWRYLERLEVQGYSPHTLKSRRTALALFLAWAEARALVHPTSITRPILLRYQRHLFYYRRRTGKPLAPSTQSVWLSALKHFFSWLTKENVLLSNPASELELPRRSRPLPKEVLTPEEVETILALAEPSDALGLRDRAILEVFYSTGIRRQELVNLELTDVDVARSVLWVRLGKGRKDRVVPLGERAQAWCEKYLFDGRPELAYEPDCGTFFLSREGRRFTPDGMTQLVKGYVQRAELGKLGSCHLFRHAAATAMLENGADIRYIQEMLGHASPTTTAIYTRVSILKLREIHAATHPGARLRNPAASAEPAEEPDPSQVLEEILEDEEDDLGDQDELVSEGTPPEA